MQGENEQARQGRQGRPRLDGAGQWQPQIGRDSGRRVEDSADRGRPARGWRGAGGGWRVEGGGSGRGSFSRRGGRGQTADGRRVIGTCWRVAALGFVFCRGFGRRRGRQVAVVRTAETGGNDVATRQAKHKQAAKQTARQLRWDPGKQTQALSHTAVTKAAGLARGQQDWSLDAGSRVLGAWRWGWRKRGGEGCCMQVQGCKRPNRLSAGEMPGSTERRETKTTQPNPARPCLVQSGAEEEWWVSGRQGALGEKKVEWAAEVVCSAATSTLLCAAHTMDRLYVLHFSICTLAALD